MQHCLTHVHATPSPLVLLSTVRRWQCGDLHSPSSTLERRQLESGKLSSLFRTPWTSFLILKGANWWYSSQPAISSCSRTTCKLPISMTCLHDVEATQTHIKSQQFKTTTAYTPIIAWEWSHLFFSRRAHLATTGCLLSWWQARSTFLTLAFKKWFQNEFEKKKENPSVHAVIVTVTVTGGSIFFFFLLQQSLFYMREVVLNQQPNMDVWKASLYGKSTQRFDCI